MEAFKKVKHTVDKSLEKVRSKPWTEPLGKTLNVTGKIVNGCGNFIPGAGIIAGALSCGSSLLNPEPSLQELQKQLNEVTNVLQSISMENTATRSAMEEHIKKIEGKMANPSSEIRTDFDKIQSEMLNMMENIQENNDYITEEIAQIKDVTNRTFNLVTDIRYKVSIEYLSAQSSILVIGRYPLEVKVLVLTGWN